MEDQLIGFETAKLAKEKGFDPRDLEAVAKHKDDGVAYVTQSFLQKWLREKYEIAIHVWPIIYTNDTKMYYTWGVVSKNHGSFGSDHHRKSENYENELEAGLIRALNML
jgi:hypothetical protein